MIDASRNFEAGIKMLTDDMDKDINKDIPLQGMFLNSERFNEAMKTIESELNELYEKTRVLEDIIAYTKEFLAEEIHKNKAMLYNKLKAIEETRDSLKDHSYISHVVTFYDNNSQIVRDRDGSALDHCHLYNGNLTLSGQELELIKVKDVIKRQELMSYNDNLENLKKSNSYRAFYLLDGPAKNGVKEKITFMFEDVKNINFLSIDTANCDILNISFINENDVEEQGFLLENAVLAKRKVKGVSITIISENYETLAYEISKDFVEPDFWENASFDAYQKITKGKSSYDIEKASGMERYKKQYEQYLKELEEWKEEKRKVDERNRILMQKYAKEMEEWHNSQQQKDGE